MKKSDIDVLIIGEGTYPYIRGGVSSWIHQLITGLKEFKFGILFIGSTKSDYGEKRYEFPDNVVYFDEAYIFEKQELPIPKKLKIKKEYLKVIENFHNIFKDREKSNNFALIQEIIENISLEEFLYSDIAWEFIVETYMKKYRHESFVDYFWTIRNMHIPLWELFKVLNSLPKVKLVHSPSTGYAGFLAGLIKLKYNIPYLLTEHGIYTRERKIDLLTADWYDSKIDLFNNEESKLKMLWNRFFEGIGISSYYSADKILSLFEKARQIQIEYGAPEKKTMVLPNGVNVHRLKSSLEKRPSKNPMVVGLIGRVVPIKDIKTFIKAMKIVSISIPNAEGWIVGPTDENPEYYEECVNLVKALDLEENVKFLGFQNILDIFPKISINTLTSISEGMPLSVLEGFAAGLPAVTTDVGSCSDLIYGGLNEEDKGLGSAGFVCKVANAKELAESYIKLLTDEELWKEFQKTALTRVNRFYTQEIFFENYRKLYKEALNWQE